MEELPKRTTKSSENTKEIHEVVKRERTLDTKDIEKIDKVYKKIKKALIYITIPASIISMAWGYKVGQEWSKDSWYEGVYIDGKTPEEIEKIKEQIENEKEEFPLILIIVDGFVEFCEETYQRYDDSLYLILREGEKLGIKVMISIESFSGMYISMRIAELFKTKICLYMKDKYAYTEVFDVIQISVFPKAEIPGRGIAYYGERILEFQTALALNVHNDYERREKIKEVLNRGVADGIC